MEFSATAKYLRNSPRKMRLVADSIRKLTPQEALVRLAHLPKAGAKPLKKVMESAVANAAQKQVKVDALKFKRIEVMGGPAMKRSRAVSHGVAHAYKKRMTHVRIELTN